jgi:hypothetical protein
VNPRTAARLRRIEGKARALEAMEAQVARGELTIRWATTAEDRELYGIKPPPPPKRAEPSRPKPQPKPTTPKSRAQPTPRRIPQQPPCELCGAPIERLPARHVRRFCCKAHAVAARTRDARGRLI